MGKLETTKKSVKEAFPRIISIGFCDLQNLLYYESPIAYTHGIYGWNSDIYHITSSTVIVTGYRPFGNINPSHTLIKKYEGRARSVRNSAASYDDKKKEVQELLESFVADAMGEWLKGEKDE